MAIIDVVKFLKIENPANGGTQTDYLPTESNPNQDYGGMKGVVFDGVTGNRIDGVSGVQMFYDTASGNTSGWSLTDLAQRLFGRNVEPGIPTDADQLVWSSVSGMWLHKAGSSLKMKSGRVQAAAFSGNPKTAAVTFTTPFSVSGYGVNLTGSDPRAWDVDSKTVSGFVINANANQALTGEVYWQATVDGETT